MDSINYQEREKAVNPDFLVLVDLTEWLLIFQSFIHASYPNLFCNSEVYPYIFACKQMDPKVENIEIDNNNKEFINSNENMFNIGSFDFI